MAEQDTTARQMEEEVGRSQKGEEKEKCFVLVLLLMKVRK